jgi:hypothetical protein
MKMLWMRVGLAGVLAGASSISWSATVTYTSEATFLSQVGPSFTDDYSAPGYAVGDVSNGSAYDYHTDAHMTAVQGQTAYTSTQYSNWNIIGPSFPLQTDPTYCAGCNGTFRLTFTSTSYGSANGVYGVGFNYYNQGSPQYTAYVTYGNGTTENIALPVTSTGLYFGITSDLLVKSIHFGLANGGTTPNGLFGIDDLTIASSPVPLPAGVWLLLSGGGALVGVARRRRKSAASL